MRRPIRFGSRPPFQSVRSSTLFAAALFWGAAGCSPSMAQEPTTLATGYLRVAGEALLPLSRLAVPPEDNGLAGARLGLRDDQTTGRFLGQTFTLREEVVGIGADPLPVFRKLLDEGRRVILLDAPAEVLLTLADAAVDRDVLLFNVSAADDALRRERCRANLFHIAPSRAMLADALAQYLVWKKWSRWFLVHGALGPDRAYADALRRAAKRFGAKIVEERVYEYAAGARRTDTGHVQVQQQMPVFTQRAADHDVLVVADEGEVFGAYLPYRTWDARPVAGTSGLVAMSWHGAHEQWGGTQLHSRFERLAGRPMTPLDYHAWMAMRVIGEAATRTRSGDVATLRAFIRGEDFGLAAFKGQPLTFRGWNQQLRQPVLLATEALPVSVSPQPGFLHQRSELDTLGIDEPESGCRLN